LVYLSPRVAAAVAGVVLVLGPIALIELHRGLAAPAGAGIIAPAPQVPLRKEPGRVPPPASEALAPDPGSGSLFAPPSAGYRQTFSRPQAVSPPRQAASAMFEFDAPAPFPTTGARPGAAGLLAPEAPLPKRRERVTRSPSCEAKMPEDSWLDICG
jgi:hypothetical protein